MATSPQHRPGGITLIVVLAVISGVLNILGGIFVIIDRHDHRLINESGAHPDELLWAAILTIVVGIIVIMLASALGRGSRGARLVFGIFAVLNLAGGLVAAFSYVGEQRTTGIISAVIWAFVLYLLYGSERDREFFLA
ncbi:MAG TPA: hypothetical protein VIH82_03605 [Acidimicrobiia bacterium]|jgi:hypothetical protein